MEIAKVKILSFEKLSKQDKDLLIHLDGVTLRGLDSYMIPVVSDFHEKYSLYGYSHDVLEHLKEALSEDCRWILYK